MCLPRWRFGFGSAGEVLGSSGADPFAGALGWDGRARCSGTAEWTPSLTLFEVVRCDPSQPEASAREYFRSVGMCLPRWHFGFGSAGEVLGSGGADPFAGASGWDGRARCSEAAKRTRFGFGCGRGARKRRSELRWRFGFGCTPNTQRQEAKPRNGDLSRQPRFLVLLLVLLIECRTIRLEFGWRKDLFRATAFRMTK